MSIAAPPTVLTVRNVSKSFRSPRRPFGARTRVLVDASLHVDRGEIVGLVGENGSGKSTLMQIIAGRLGRDGGVTRIQGAIGYCPQYPQLWEKLTVAEHFELFSLAYGLEPEAASTQRSRLLDDLSFARSLGYRVENLSGGTRQKLNLALALLHEPDVLLLDEPYSGFDWETYTRFWDLAEVYRSRGMAILIVSHLIGEQSRLSRLYKLQDGTCVEA